jgi:hypothetical protein
MYWKSRCQVRGKGGEAFERFGYTGIVKPNLLSPLSFFHKNEVARDQIGGMKNEKGNFKKGFLKEFGGGWYRAGDGIGPFSSGSCTNKS